ncbi:MAG: mechanosensitive ion channel family protein, partial [Gammaproteobacteria bacterium]
MENIITSLRDLGWGAEVFAAVLLTLIIRFIAIRILDMVGKRLRATENLWDDALFLAAHRPLSWFILIFGLIWTISISDGYLDTELFSVRNLDRLRQLTFISLITWFLLSFMALAEQRLLEDIETKPADETRMDATTLHALTKLFRLSVIISAALIALPTFGIEITALLAAGGVGGIAIG